MEILCIIIGLALVLGGAHLLTEGAAATAEKFGVSQFIIGLTVISVGTSMPEFVVSLSAALKGSSDMAVGNVVGSDIFNIFATLGICALLSPVELTKRNVRIDIPFAFAATVMLFLFSSDRLLHFGTVDRIGRIEGAVMFLFYVALMVCTVRAARDGRRNSDGTNPGSTRTAPRMGMWKAALFIIVGLAGLTGGSELFVDNVSAFAEKRGISEAVISITLVAAGTSLPELVTGIVAVFKGSNDMALGNVIGSNIFNTLFIIGGCAMVTPLTMGGIDTLDLLMAVLSALLPLLFAFTFNGQKINRIEGFLLLVIYALYIRHLVK